MFLQLCYRPLVSSSGPKAATVPGYNGDGRPCGQKVDINNLALAHKIPEYSIYTPYEEKQNRGKLPTLAKLEREKPQKETTPTKKKK